MSELILDLRFVLFILKVLSVIIALGLFTIAAGWLRGANNLLLPGLGIIITAPLLILVLAIAEVVIIVAFGVLSALVR